MSSDAAGSLGQAACDHLIYATPDLEATIEELSSALGVRPEPGGKHAAWATRNALLSLGERCYLEVLAPDPEGPAPDQPRPFDMDSLSGPRLVAWSAQARGLERWVERGRQAGVELGEVTSRSRTRPDGSLLSWSMTDLEQPREGNVVPFFVDWGDSEHPAVRAPAGCRMSGFRAEHPEAERVQGILSALGLDLEVASGPEPKLFAVLESTSGRVVL